MDNVQTKPNTPVTWPMVIVLAAVVFAVVQCSDSSAKAERAPAVAKCVDKGVSYFKEIGSYPHLSDGRSAAVVAAERCGRTLTAF